MEEVKVKDYKKIVEEFLQNQENSETLISSICKKFDGFIMPNHECCANLAFGNSMQLDDLECYEEFLKQFDTSNFPDSFIGYMLFTFNFVSNYFGIQRDEQARQELNFQLGDNHSIKRYKGKGVAMCYERATLAQNLLKLKGVSSSLILNSSHAYNLLETEKSYIIYDATNFINATYNGVKYVYPAFKVFEKAKLHNFMHGEETAVIDNASLKKLIPNYEVEEVHFEYPGLNLPEPKVEMEEELNV